MLCDYQDVDEVEKGFVNENASFKNTPNAYA